MARKLLILGRSGTGKSHSLQTLDPKTTIIICPEDKELPFRGSVTKYRTLYKKNPQGITVIDKVNSNWVPLNGMKAVTEYIKGVAMNMPSIKTIAVDTLTYALVESTMREKLTKGYDKFTEFADELYVLFKLIPMLRKDLVVIFTAHTDIDNFDGQKMESFKVPAGQLAKKIVPEGMFTVVLYADCVSGDSGMEWFFETQNNGSNTAKSPDGMFPGPRIQNDMQYVIDCMDAYYKEEDAPESKEVTVE